MPLPVKFRPRVTPTTISTALLPTKRLLTLPTRGYLTFQALPASQKRQTRLGPCLFSNPILKKNYNVTQKQITMAAIPSTFRIVTEKKLAMLAEKRKNFETARDEILHKVNEEPNQAEKVKILLKGLEKLEIMEAPLGISVENVERFLDQSIDDPSVSPLLIQKWQSKLKHGIEIQTRRYEFATIFGRLAMEWMENPNVAVGSENSAKSINDESSIFQEIGREEMHDQRKQWESYAFTERPTDTNAIGEYLKELFESPSKKKRITKTPLENLRDQISRFGKNLEFDVESLNWCISGVLKNDLFTGKKREELQSLKNKPSVLKEMVDVLNMDLAMLQDWKWDAPVKVQQRRQLNGKYRVYMDEEIHDALLFHFIGAHWAAHFKSCFTSFFHSGEWMQSSFISMGKKDKARRQHFLGNAYNSDYRNSVRDIRRVNYRDQFFLNQLPSSVDKGPGAYEDDGPGNNEMQQQIGIKQSILNVVTTELLLNKKLYSQFTVLQSDFKWFGPSLPHSTIFSVLEFFHVAPEWLAFFKKFLESPIVFSDDGPDAEVRTRKCGVPISHTLSTALGETVLFCLDFAINKRTMGQNIYRLHDDLWFWGQHASCVDAWKAMIEFCHVMGLELNEEKTGALLITDQSKRSNTTTLSPELPQGKIKSGFLILDAERSRWMIDMDMVENHITELRRQLSGRRSILSWVQGWNSYVDNFFSMNFGQPVNCFGREHIDMVIKTFKYVQEKLFADTPNSNGSVVEYLRNRMRERFGVENIPDGVFYLPIEMGGLGLRNPLIPLFLRQKTIYQDTEETMDSVFEVAENDYEKAKQSYNSGDLVKNHTYLSGEHRPTADESFMSFKEFIRFAEETSSDLANAYTSLQDLCEEITIKPTVEMSTALEEAQTISGVVTKEGFGASDWSDLRPYWRWIIQLYGEDIVERFGGLSTSDRGLLPIGLLGMLQSEKVRWQG